MEKAKPGVNCSTRRRASTRGRVVNIKGGGQAFRALGGVMQAYDVVTDYMDNAGVKGYGKGFHIVDGPWIFHDDGGDFRIDITRGWVSTSYQKVYVWRKVPGSTTMPISSAEADYFQRIGNQRWGYKKFNWWTGEWEFVPGTERKSLPVKMEGVIIDPRDYERNQS
jgi:hypothetical protein